MATKAKSVCVRIAPSPTGLLHLGTARAALFNYLFAKQQGGTFIIRIEDTDKARSKAEYEEDMLVQLAWLGLGHDHIYRQSERVGEHTTAIQHMLTSGAAYVSSEPAKDDPEKMVEVVRLRNPGERISFEDRIRGTVTFDTTELGDFVIARSIEEPLYHLAVVVDDADMGVTHVIRGEDHISNTPRQILIQRALGYDEPAYAHLPLILGSDRSKLSKRKNDTSVASYRAQGFLPEALINYLALLGWNPGTDQELFTIDELIEAFSLEHVQKGGAVFDIEKLRWFNREYLHKMSDTAFKGEAFPRFEEALAGRISHYNALRAELLLPILRDRVSVWGDIEAIVGEGEFDYFFDTPALERTDLPWKDTGIPKTKEHLEYVLGVLEEQDEKAFQNPEVLRAVIAEYAEKEGRGEVLWPFRYALTGKTKSPDGFAVASILGREETLTRISVAVNLIS